MDFNLAELPPDFKQAVEDACNAAIQSDHRVEVTFVPIGAIGSLVELSRAEEVRLPVLDLEQSAHRRPGRLLGHPGRSRHPRRLDASDRGDAGGQNRKQGKEASGECASA